MIYAVEPVLTQSFDRLYDSIDNVGERNYFCLHIFQPKIHIITTATQSPENSSGDVVAFVLDSADNIPTISPTGLIQVKVSTNTIWIRRDVFLVHYLKNCPCKREAPPSNLRQQPVQEADIFDF
jgi:hypothetical protein